MSLTGVSPADPRPAIRREFIFGAGPPTGAVPDRPVVLWGNKTSAGTETVDVLGDPIVDDADAAARGGARSEVYAMYRKFTAIPQTATIYYMCPTESAGTAAAVVFNVADGDSDAVTTYKITVGDAIGFYTTSDGEEEQSVAEGIADVIDNMDGGRCLVTTATAVDGAGPDWDLTVTFAHKGLRGDNYIGAGATYGVTITSVQGNNTQTITKGTRTDGATADDWTTAIAYMANEEFYYHVAAKSAVTTVTATDNGLGELMTMLAAQAAPSNGKDQRLIFACVGTNANAIALAISSAMNSVYATCLWSEKHHWSTGEMAAHYAGVIRQQEITNPAVNINGWTNDSATNKTWLMPPPQNKGDYPTAAETIAALNNGITPLTVRGGRTYIERHITTRSLNAAGNNDYRAREGHIPSVAHAAWAIARQRYEGIRQPNADYDPAGTTPPTALTTTPSQIRDMLRKLTADLSGSSPLGQYPGPWLAPTKAPIDQAATVVTYDGKGGFPTHWPITAVQHNIKWEVVLAEQSESY